MLHEILKAYLVEVEEAVLSYQEAYVERYLPNFSHHKYLPNKVVAFGKPTVKMVIQEVVAQFQNFSL
jgi:hypothetical protein